MKKILVPTDFSPNATKALDFAVHIAQKAKSEIILLHACLDLMENTFKDNLVMYREYNQDITNKAYEQLLAFKKSIGESENIVVTILLYKGTVYDSILQASAEHHPDLIIMGTLGEAGLKETIIGSKTARIIGKTNIPVMAVPLFSEWEMPKRILLTVNNFEENPDIINPAIHLAALFNATIHIAIFTDSDTSDTFDYLKNERNITNYEQKLKNRYKAVDIKSVHLNGHRFQETIEEYILEQGINIVAMVTYKRTFMENIFNPSKTRKMSYHTRIPLLAIPANNSRLVNKTLQNENMYSNQWV